MAKIKNPKPPSSSKTSSTSSSTANSNTSPKPQNASLIKAYWIPATLFILSFVFQAVFMPKSYPPSHYDALGIQLGSSIEEVEEVYKNLVSKWNSGAELPKTADFIKIRYAYELLTDSIQKRDYDLFGIDEHQHIMENLMQQNSGKSYSSLNLPLIDVESMDSHDNGYNNLTFEDLQSVAGNPRPWLVQVYSNGSELCTKFGIKWKKIVTLLGEVADTGVVELGDFDLASHLAERKTTGKLFFRNGLPSLIAFPQGCRASNCLVRYEGELSVDAVTDWFATTILRLPRIPYYTKESLGPRFLAKSSYHKVKVLIFSDTGMRAYPFVRQLAKKYQDYASFACVLWREEEYSFWLSTYGVESAPATVLLKDPGTKPSVYYGSVDSTWFVNVMENNKLHELPQLRSVTSMELGCDARGYSRAGSSTNIWYCVILVGRPSQELDQMREVLRRVQQSLFDKVDGDAADIDEVESPSAIAFKDKRLTFVWMDGEVQKNLCMFYIGSELSLTCCGPRRGIEDTPQMVMVRYMRNDSVTDIKDRSASNSLFDVLKDDVDPVAQLVAHYKGSADHTEIMKWISKIVEDGDSAKLPFYRASTPELVPEGSDALWSAASETFISSSDGLKHTIKRILVGCRDLSGDPRIGPILLLGALISFGKIWLCRSQPTSSTASSGAGQTSMKKDIPKEWRDRNRASPFTEAPPSMTDTHPKDAYQVELSDSDDE